jgi:energy-coupling factor transporter transmembrane protein EcfT
MENNNNGFLFVMFLTLLFITLKITEKIAWSWLWVLSPLWIYFGLGFILFVTFLTLFLLHKREQNENNRK